MRDYLSSQIRLAREAAGKTMEEMAPLLDVSLRTYTRIESGETKRVPVDRLVKIAQITQKPLSFFVNANEDAA